MRVISALCAIALVGCAANTLRPEAQKVRLLGATPGPECKYMGDATGGQGNFFTGQYTSNANLQTGALNDLKNQAAAMGGNAVYVLANNTGLDKGTQTSVTSTGNVYFCKNQ
ncbi:MAG: DUF4156 domain-containing protein [Fluviibacter sp.]|jgi:hypothetical protein